jgi:outer membrane biosynthesis protein TonB
MNGVTRTILGASALTFALALGGCENFDMPELFNTKKPLPGERHAVFPEGVPGAPNGVPAELIKGNQAADPTASVPTEGVKPAAAAKAEEKPKPKPKPKVAAKSAPAAKQASAEAKSNDSDVWPPPPKANAPAQATAAPWPAPAGNKPATAWPAQ